MYANICRTTNSIEREIAERQLGMKAINDNSWFSKLKQILAIYELPSSHNILDLPPTKNAWKKMVNKAVNRPLGLSHQRMKMCLTNIQRISLSHPYKSLNIKCVKTQNL